MQTVGDKTAHFRILKKSRGFFWLMLLTEQDCINSSAFSCPIPIHKTYTKPDIWKLKLCKWHEMNYRKVHIMLTNPPNSSKIKKTSDFITNVSTLRTYKLHHNVSNFFKINQLLLGKKDIKLLINWCKENINVPTPDLIYSSGLSNAPCCQSTR